MAQQLSVLTHNTVCVNTHNTAIVCVNTQHSTATWQLSVLTHNKPTTKQCNRAIVCVTLQNTIVVCVTHDTLYCNTAVICVNEPLLTMPAKQQGRIFIVQFPTTYLSFLLLFGLFSSSGVAGMVMNSILQLCPVQYVLLGTGTPHFPYTSLLQSLSTWCSVFLSISFLVLFYWYI